MEQGKLNIQTVENTLCKPVEPLPEAKLFANMVSHKFLLLGYKTDAAGMHVQKKQAEFKTPHEEFMTEMLILNKKLGQKRCGKDLTYRIFQCVRHTFLTKIFGCASYIQIFTQRLEKSGGCVLYDESHT